MKSVPLFLIPLLATIMMSLSAGADTVMINGAGATFPYPLYSKWFSEFHKIDSSIEINYQSIGSGGGIRQLLDKTIDFGASDAPMTDEQLTKGHPAILHIPTVMGAVAITYNLVEVKTPLKLTGEMIADIFLGKIKTWGDAQLLKLNPELSAIKDLPILVVHRSDGSGTTAVFSDYLSKTSADWKQKVGAGNALQWPTGLGGKGNEGVTGMVKQSPGAVGYAELSYLAGNQLPLSQIKNKAGSFISPSTKSVTAAANGFLKSMPKDFRLSITDAPGKEAYPISSFTYLLVYQTMEKNKGQKLLAFINWALADGQKLAEPLAYAPLPKELAAKVKLSLKEMKTE